MKNIYFIIIILILIFTPQIFVNCQLSWKTSVESGYLNSTGDNITGLDEVQIKLEGLLKYDYEKEKEIASVYFRIKPELFGFNNVVRSLRLKGFCSYSYDFDNFVGGINLTSQRHIFAGNNLKINYESFLLSSDFNFEIKNGTSATINLGYAYQRLSTDEQNNDIFFVDTRLNYEIDSNLKFSSGIYIEKFSIIAIDRTFYPYKKYSNIGWRLGPKLSLSFIKGIAANFEYSFLVHDSKLTLFPSYEHWVRVVMGKMISKNWSVFLLTDYYIRRFKLINPIYTESNLIYTPMNLENRIYIKIGFDISSTSEIFFKSGYFKENLYKNNMSFKGWNALIGFEIER